MNQKKLFKYLESYGHHPVGCAAEYVSQLSGVWNRLVVVPVCDELEETPVLLTSLSIAARSYRVLVVFVLNQRVNASLKIQRGNHGWRQWIKSEISCTFDTGMTFAGRYLNLDIFVIDHAMPNTEFSIKDGVGLARKVGLDFGVYLYSCGRLLSPWMATTDADACVSEDYFTAKNWQHADEVAAAVFPFMHHGADNEVIQSAIDQYEQVLFSYVDGLSYAGSRNAYHTLGSIILVRVDAYVAVRGVPRLLAGEDFHLLSKIRKVGIVKTLKSHPIYLKARASDRVPYGTGRALQAVVNGDAPVRTPYDRALFGLLKVFLAECLICLGDLDVARLHAQFLNSAQQSGVRSGQVVELFKVLNVDGFFNQPSLAALPNVQRHKRFHDWFDGLKTLRFVNTLKNMDLCVPN